MRHLFTALLIVFSAFLSAQSDSLTRFHLSPVFAQVGLGLLPHPENFNAEFSVAAGYRFNQHIGLGLEYRSTFTSNISFGMSASGIGVHFRGQFDGGWLVNVGAGPVVSAFQGNDSSTSYEYRAGGVYMGVDIGYQTRWGIILGVYGTLAQGMSHNVLEYNDNTNRPELTGAYYENSLGSGGVKLGFAFPWRGKRG